MPGPYSASPAGNPVALHPQRFPPPPPLFFFSSSCRDGVEDGDSQGDGSSQPDTISIASRTSQNTVDSDKVGQRPHLPPPKTSRWLSHPGELPPKELLPLRSLTSGAGGLLVGLQEMCHVEILSEGTEIGWSARPLVLRECNRGGKGEERGSLYLSPVRCPLAAGAARLPGRLGSGS